MPLTMLNNRIIHWCQGWWLHWSVPIIESSIDIRVDDCTDRFPKSEYALMPELMIALTGSQNRFIHLCQSWWFYWPVPIIESSIDIRVDDCTDRFPKSEYPLMPELMILLTGSHNRNMHWCQGWWLYWPVPGIESSIDARVDDCTDRFPKSEYPFMPGLMIVLIGSHNRNIHWCQGWWLYWPVPRIESSIDARVEYFNDDFLLCSNIHRCSIITKIQYN